MSPTYPPRVIAAWLHGYDAGHNVGRHDGRTEGWREGYAAALQDVHARVAAEVEQRWAALHAVGAETARQVADREPFDVLADRRGQHDRAARQRALLQARGVSA